MLDFNGMQIHWLGHDGFKISATDNNNQTRRVVNLKIHLILSDIHRM
jgi:hypothetical protein